MTPRSASLLIAFSVCASADASAQGTTEVRRDSVIVDTASVGLPGGWNSARVRDLVERARLRRAAPRLDSGFTTYQAHAQGYVYFYLDRENSEQRTLIKVDQVALNVYWATPGRTKQVILGMRDANRLPNRMQYHLDHLTVVQDDFGDLIRLGDGDEVRSVPHPAAQLGADTYDYILADSLTLQLAPGTDAVRVYEIKVRPVDVNRPAFIGSLFIDRATAAIVRMTFTFTPASYVDRRLDYINVSLDNALWQGRYWLPNEQRIEIRRQVPELDFPAGAVIRGIMRINQYEFNKPIPDEFFLGAPVVAAGKQEREAYPFEQGIYEGLAQEGLASPPQMQTLREMAAQLAREKYLSGLPRLRIHFSGASSGLRFNRAEGVFTGAGISYAPSGSVRLELAGGWAASAKHPAANAELRTVGVRTTAFSARAYLNELRDIGLQPGAPGAFNTLAAAFTGRDYLDPYFASGGRVQLEHRFGAAWISQARAFVEQNDSASLVRSKSLTGSGGEFRPVRAIAAGTLTGGAVAFTREATQDSERTWSGEVSVEAGTLRGDTYIRPLAQLTATTHSMTLAFGARLSGTAGVVFGDVPAQKLFLIGGRETLPGYRYRSFGGTRFALVQTEATRELFGPWLTARAAASGGWTDAPLDALPAAWNVARTGGLKSSVSAGVGLFSDILRIDLARGLNGGEWQWLLSVSPAVRDIL
jgi:hypothetical protein